MAKVAVIVTTSVVTIVILFIIFSYLLSIVNPGQIVTNATYFRRSEELQDFDDEKSDLLYPNDELNAKDNVHFGLEKVPENYELFPNTDESKGNADIGKRFAQKPGYIPAVTVKSTSNIKYGDYILTTDGKMPVTLLVFPLKDNQRQVREQKNKETDKSSNNVLLKIIDVDGQTKLEVIAESAHLVYNQEVNNTKRELGIDTKVMEIKPNNTLLYNMNDQTFKIVNYKTPYVINNAIDNSSPRPRNEEQLVEKRSINVQGTDKINSKPTVAKTPEAIFLTTALRKK